MVSYSKITIHLSGILYYCGTEEKEFWVMVISGLTRPEMIHYHLISIIEFLAKC